MFKIEFDKKDIASILNSLKKIESGVKKQLIVNGGAFNRLCSVDYSQLVTKNIFSRKSPSPPYSKAYAKWKKKNSLMGSPSPWRLTGDLVNAISVFRSGNGWGSGLKSDVYSSGRLVEKTLISDYANKEEKRRPIFTPSAKEYSNSTLRKGRINKMLNTISWLWK